jgi:hypothetical protein
MACYPCSAKTATFLFVEDTAAVFYNDEPIDDGSSFPYGVYPYSAVTVVF